MPSLCTRLFLACLLYMFGACVYALVETQETTLENGLKVIVRSDHRAPVVAVQIWYKVGSAYEHNGITGISHMLEHMMFKGTPKYPAGKLHEILIQKGGQHNAFTSTDCTAYTENISVDALETVFELEADRMRHLTLDQAAFEKERQVVAEERRLRTEDVPPAVLNERFNAAAHIATPYHHPVVGWMSDIQDFTLADLKRWYETWYVPNNATLVVVGDVAFDDIVHLAKTHFGKLKSGIVQQRKKQTPLPMLGERRIKVAMPAKIPQIRMGYNVPSFNSVPEKWEAYALMLLCSVLDEGASSRLEKQLVRREMVASGVNAYYQPYGLYPTTLEIVAVPAKDRTLSEVENSIMTQLNQLKTTLVSQAELNKIKQQVIAQKVYERDSMTHQALEIGWLESIGLSWVEGEQYVAELEKITPEQIQKVARKYLVPERLIVGRLIPQTLVQQEG